MCSIGDSELDEENSGIEMMKSDHKILTDSDICRKCKINKADIILRVKDFYCKECFTTYFVHKFRSTIGKSKEIKHDDQILVAFSAGSNSTTLLRLIQSGLNEGTTAKRIRFHPHVIFIDESTFRPSCPSIKQVYKQVADMKFSFSFTYFEEVLKDENQEISIATIKDNEDDLNISEMIPQNPDQSNALIDLLEQRMKSQTSREDILRQLRMELLSRCAKQLGFGKVFVGDNATGLSVQILSSVALGRGSQLGDNVTFKSTHFGIEFFRPLREIFDEEIDFYIKNKEIFVLDDQQQSTSSNSIPSVVSCTRDFIYSLQKEFFSTVPTVFRTGGKLINGNRQDRINTEGIKENTECLFCGLQKDTSNNTESSALSSIKLSKKLTRNQPPKSVDEENLFLSNGVDLDCDDDEIFKNFCYGCSNLMREMGDSESYPPRIRNKIQENKTKNLIQDYLIED